MKLRREAKIGLFALLMLLALYWGINFLRGRDIFNRTDTYYATYDQVNGVQKSSAIVIKGFKVGVVGDIRFDPTRSDQIVLALNISSKYRIPENSQARIFSDGLMGGKAVEIVLGNSERFLNSRDTLHSSADKDILELAGSELEVIKQKFTVVADNLSATLVSLNNILEQNSESIAATLDHLSRTASSLDYVVSSERENLRSAIANIEEFTAMLGRNSGNFDTMISDMGRLSGKLAAVDVEAMSATIDRSLARLESILASVDGGEGSLGQLLRDDGLYDSLSAATANLSALLEDLKAHPGRYVNISVFGRKEK